MDNLVVLSSDSLSVQYLCSKDKRLAKLISLVGDIEYVPHIDGYSFLVHEIIEQMLSIKAGQKIFMNLAAKCNNQITVDSIYSLSLEDIRSAGVSNAKAICIKNITQLIKNNQLHLKDLNYTSDGEVIKVLTSVKGIGTWTAKMYLIFVLDRQNVLPFEDGAFLQVYRWLYKTNDLSKQSIIKKCKKWSPYSSIAARFMYRALDTGITKEDFHLFK